MVSAALTSGPARTTNATNNGGGVGELLVNTVDLSKTNSDATGVSLQRLGASAAATTNHDGISCHRVLTLVPFPT